MTGHKSLLDERVVAVQPSLVAAFGLGALVVQQVHWHLSSSSGQILDGHRWAVLPYDAMSAETGLSVHQLRRLVAKLEDAGVLVSCQPEHWQRRKWYRIDYESEAFAPSRPSGESAGSNRRDRRMTSGESAGSLLTDQSENPPVVPPRGDRARGTRLPDRFVVTDAMAEWVLSEHPTVDAHFETQQFVDYYRSAPGARGRKTDWETAWRVWIRRAAKGAFKS